ncbi:MAG: tetratricopeptide repeat protein [Akkermansiaceae bacterium]|jgi:tetratricopeptide (TPR) repeat protein
MPEIDELYEALEEAREADQVASACVLYEEILTNDEEEDLASTLLYAHDLIDLGNYGQALATLQRIEDLVPESGLASFYWARGTAFEETGDLAQAERCYREAAEKDRENRGGYLIQAAGMAFRQGEPAKAEYLVREALKADCERDEAYGNLGYYLACQRRFSEARTAFEEVLRIDPENENAREWLMDLEHLVS